MQKRKVVILGAGHVGSHCALSLLFGGLCEEIVLLDILEKKAAGQALDLSDAAVSMGFAPVIRAGTDDDMKDASILIMAAGRGRKEGETRLDLFYDSVRMLKNDIIPRIKQSGFSGILISISNPADVVGELLRRGIGFPRERAFSTGTGLDSLRLRRVIAQDGGVSAHSVNALCMGEHGDSHMVPWSRVCVGGQPFLTLRQQDPERWGKTPLDELTRRGKEAGMFEVTHKSCTEFGIGTVAARLVAAIFHDEKVVLPVSTALQGEYGEDNVAAGVPAVIGAGGMEKIVTLPLTPEEKEAFHASCDVLRSYLEKADNL